MEIASKQKTIDLKEELRTIIKVLFLVGFFFGISIYKSYATDTYATLSNAMNVVAKDMLYRNGRPVIALMYELHYLTGLPTIDFYYVSSVLALVFLAAAIYLYARVLKKYITDENKRIFLSFACIANLFIINYFTFIEKCGFMLAILFSVAGAYFTDCFFATRKVKDIVLAELMVILAMFTYQGTVALYVLLCLPLLYYHAKDLKSYFRCLIDAVGVYLIAVLVDMLILKYVIQSIRVAETSIISNLLSILGKAIAAMKTMNDYLPAYSFIVIIVVILIAFIFVSICFAREQEHPLCFLLHEAVILASVFLFSFASVIQGSGYYAMRVIYPFASLPALLVLYISINQKKATNADKCKQAATILIFAALFFIVGCQYLVTERIFISKYEVNLSDELRCSYIGQAITEYEEETGESVTKIAFYDDSGRTNPAYPHLSTIDGDASLSSFYTNWSDLNAINYYLGTSYERAESDEEYAAYFAGQNWDTLSKEQLIFDGDTLHYCLY